MEYLSRILSHKNRNFDFHPRCMKLDITHLMFADDLLFFSKGSVGSVKILFEAFRKISNAFGLEANPQKICVYFVWGWRGG